jgi:hypothetical protein
MLKKIAVGLGVVVLVLLAVVATRPATFHIERSADVKSGTIAHGYVNDFHKWAAWSPWEHLDTAAKKTFSGPAAGTGAVYTWDGNDKAGAGKMTITSSTPSEIVIDLEFTRPYPSKNTTTFKFSAPGEAHVTWAMDGTNNMMAKAASLFMDMDKMLGPDFDKGLQQIAALTATDVATAAAAAKPPEATPPAAATAEPPPIEP